jgi:DNA-directed RNA polymerase specialized sigma24 family protein
MSYEEVAQAMNKSVRAVATLLFRARENLRTRLLPLQKRGLL